MSAIDSYDHAHIANYCGIAMYWPLGEIDSKDLADTDGFIVDKNYILIGGGSGEHPCLILNIDQIVQRYFLYLYEDNQNYNNEEVEEFNKLINKIEDEFYKDYGYFKFPTQMWPLSSYLSIYEKLGKSELDLEDRISFVVAKTIIEKMPIESIKSDDLKKVVQIYRGDKDNINKNFASELEYINNDYEKALNFTDKNLAPMGRIFIDGNVKWGFNLMDYYQLRSSEELYKSVKKLKM